MNSSKISIPPFAVRRLHVCCLMVLGASNGIALAQTPRPDAGQILRDQSPAPLAAPASARPLLPISPDAPALPQDDTPVTVQRFALEGNSRFEAAALEPLLASVQGRSVRFAEINAAVARITAFYRERGYFLARAIIPRQAMQSGVLRVQILEGVIGQVQVTSGAASGSEDVAISAALFENILKAQGLQMGQSVQVEPLERAIVLFTERGYPDANLGLSPGSSSGSTALSMRWSKARAPWAASVSTDNSASRYTGTIRLLGDASAYSLATQDDRLSLRASLSGFEGTKSGNTQFFSLGYSLPLGFDGWRIGANASALNYKLGGSFAALQASGDAKSFGLNASYPLALSANSQSLLDLSLLQRRAVDDSLAGNVNDKATRVAMLAHSYSRSSELAGKGFNQRLQSAFSAGRLDLSRNAGAAAFDAANAAAAGRFTKLRFDYTAAYAVSAGHQLQARLSQQFASKNLDSSEKISLGGANGVRAYPVGEANGDGGTLLSLEWRADLSGGFSPAPGLASSLTGFVDWGQIKQNQRPWAAAVATSAATGIANTYSLSGIGFSYALGRPGDWQLSATLAAPIGRNPGRNPQGNNSDGHGQHPRAWLSFQKSI